MAIYFELLIIGSGLFGFSMMVPTFIMKTITFGLIALTIFWAAESYGFVDCFIELQAGEINDRDQFWSCVLGHINTTQP